MVPTMHTDIHITPFLAAELEFLCRFNLDTRQEGIKVHHDADSDIVAAAKRLHAKAFITQPDGGYLTDRGIEAAEHIQRALGILNL